MGSFITDSFLSCRPLVNDAREVSKVYIIAPQPFPKAQSPREQRHLDWYRLTSIQHERIGSMSTRWQTDDLCYLDIGETLQWRHNGYDGVWNHQPHDCLLNCLLRRRSKKTPKLRVTGLCAGNSPGTGEFPTQMASYAENVSIWLMSSWEVTATRETNIKCTLIIQPYDTYYPYDTISLYFMQNVGLSIRCVNLVHVYWTFG